VLVSSPGREDQCGLAMPDNFAPAGRNEQIVFGACRPGRHSSDPEDIDWAEVDAWIKQMKNAGIQRVVCLLRDKQLAFYHRVPEGLLRAYAREFGSENVLPAPVEDYHLIDPTMLDTVIRFLKASDASGSKVVVHCSGGSGRTGHVLAAWLAQGRGHDALDAICIAEATRNPREAIKCGNATEAELIALVQGRKA
jgi:protein-tyrosine phosphatase